MRKWLISLAVLGAGGVGAYFMSDRGRETLRGWLAKLDTAPRHWNEWNENALAELDRIQTAVNLIAQSLGPQSPVAR